MRMGKPLPCHFMVDVVDRLRILTQYRRLPTQQILWRRGGEGRCPELPTEEIGKIVGYRSTPQDQDALFTKWRKGQTYGEVVTGIQVRFHGQLNHRDVRLRVHQHQRCRMGTKGRNQKWAVSKMATFRMVTDWSQDGHRFD